MQQQTFAMGATTGVYVGGVTSTTTITDARVEQLVVTDIFFFDSSGLFALSNIYSSLEYDRITGVYESKLEFFSGVEDVDSVTFGADGIAWVSFFDSPLAYEVNVTEGTIGEVILSAEGIPGVVFTELTIPTFLDSTETAIVGAGLPNDYVALTNGEFIDVVLDEQTDLELLNADIAGFFSFGVRTGISLQDPFVEAYVSAGLGLTTLIGTESNDTILGLDQEDFLDGGAGDDTITGGDGQDIAVFSNGHENFSIEVTPVGLIVKDRTGLEGTDILTGVESLSFSDVSIDIDKFDDLDGLSADDFDQFVEMYIAYFNRAPDAFGLFFWGSAFSDGLTLPEMAALFFDQDETRATYPALTSVGEFVEAVYGNVLGRSIDALGFDFWVDQLQSGNVDRPTFILEIIRGAKADAPAGATPDFVAQKAADVAYLANKTDLGTYFSAIKGMSDVDNARAVMSVYDGSPESIEDARDLIDDFYNAANVAQDGEFLLSVVGVIDDPF